MYCTVFLLRHKGEKLHADVVRRAPRRGELRFQLRLIGKSPQWHVMKASLIGPDGARYVAPVLDQARLVTIQRDGLLITGTEVIPTSRGIKNIKADYFRQSWYCIPETRPFDDQVGDGGWRADNAKEWAERYLQQADE